MYTDAAWNASTGAAGLGWVIDDRVSTTQNSTTALHVSSPLMAEALAVRSAINFALSCRIEEISLFSDSQTLINIINRKEMKTETFGILQDIYHSAFSFKSISFNFIPRLNNDRADLVAKQAL